MLLGKDAIAKRRRAEELEHERELARIRAESHALVWTGPPEELKEAIRQWFDAGWIRAETLDAAFLKAAIHFVRPDGTSVITQPSPKLASPSLRLKALDDEYQVIEFDGRQYELTPNQRTVIRTLHKAHLEQRGSLGIKELYKALGINSGKISQWFRGKNIALSKKLILKTSREHFRLDL